MTYVADNPDVLKNKYKMRWVKAPGQFALSASLEFPMSLFSNA
jgi:hypothetical protein